MWVHIPMGRGTFKGDGDVPAHCKYWQCTFGGMFALVCSGCCALFVCHKQLLCIWKYCQLFTYQSNTFLCENTPLKSVGRFRSKKPLKLPLLLGPPGSCLIHPSLYLPRLPPQITTRSVHALPHNYATQSPLVTMYTPNSPLKLPLPLQRSSPHLIHPSLDRSHSPSRMTSGLNQPFCHNTLSGQTNTQTNRQMG